jgi:hypothetical protein
MTKQMEGLQLATLNIGMLNKTQSLELTDTMKEGKIDIFGLNETKLIG